MAKSVIFTQNHNHFDELEVPHFVYKHNWIIKFYKFPFGLKFNKVYYKRDGKKLVAFRILAYTICDVKPSPRVYPMYYLVQLPNQPLQWMVDFITKDTKVYNSVDEFVLSNGADCVNLQWESWASQFKVCKEGVGNCYFFDYDFWTIKNGAVVKSKGACMDRFVATEDGFFVNISKKSYFGHYVEEGIYLDKMAATMDLLQVTEVVDFENEQTNIKISINVLDNTPKYTKIKFVE